MNELDGGGQGVFDSVERSHLGGVQRRADFCVGADAVKACSGAKTDATPGIKRWKKLMHPRNL